MSRKIIMSCACGNAMLYPRQSDPDIPDWVVFLEEDLCPLCDDGGRDGHERWLDANHIERDPLGPSDEVGRS